MSIRATSIAVLVVLTGARSTNLESGKRLAAHPDTLTVHEWGTFTTVAGPDGRAIDWLPLGGPTDLPCFVEHYRNRPDAKIAPNQPVLLDYVTARANLWGKVRMETPVLYFYAREPMKVDVTVRFPQGLMTEWYPHATVTQPLVAKSSLRRVNQESVISWPNVTVSPGGSTDFPSGEGESHYYAARNTDAAPVTVGGQRERFLFYRGVASFDVPLSASALGDGRLRIRNTAGSPMGGVILFENRGGEIRYRVVDTLSGEATVALSATPGSVASLGSELERVLVAAGLYPREARAMVDSWRDSWFEEGTRVFYIVPPRSVDAILPLRVTPAPASIARVFVGRMEVITPETERAVENAIAGGDTALLARHGRFLGPIADAILARTTDAGLRQRIAAATSATFASYVARARSCN
jgi:hypothetical protein